MTKTKTTPRGSSSSHQLRGMATARFAATEAEEQQFEDAGGESQDSTNWPDPFKKATKEVEGETSKSEGKTSDPPQQAKGEEAPPKENPPTPNPPDPQPGTSKDPTDVPTEVPTEDPTQTTTQNLEEEAPPILTEYIKGYKQAGKVWLDTVLEKKEQAYITLFNTLLTLGDPHIDNFPNANRQRVLDCIKDMTGRFLSADELAIYVEQEEEVTDKPKFTLTGNANIALRDYYDAVHMFCEAQTNFAASMKVLEEKIQDKAVFLDIIKQMQLPVVEN